MGGGGDEARGESEGMPVNIVFFFLLEFFSRPLQSERLEQAILAFHLIFLGRARPTQIHPKGPVSRPVIIYRLAGGGGGHLFFRE